MSTPAGAFSNALMLDLDQNPLGGVYTVLNSNGNPSVMAFSNENGLVSIPLLEDGRWTLELKKEYFKLTDGNLTLDPVRARSTTTALPRPRNIGTACASFSYLWN